MAFLIQSKTLRRIGEIAPLNLIDINLEERFIKFVLKKQGDIPHKVHITDDTFYWELIDYLEANKKEIEEHKGFLFYSKNPFQKRLHLSKDYLRNFFRVICKRAGILEPYAVATNGKKLYRLSTHSFRNEGIEKGLFDCETPIPVMQKITGHGSVTSLMKYAKKCPEEIIIEYTRKLQEKL
jgi:integrase